MSSAILREAAPPLPAGVPSGLRTIVERCLEKQPEKRYQNAGRSAGGPGNAADGGGQFRGKTLVMAGGRRHAAGIGRSLALAASTRQQPQTAARRLSTGAKPSAIREANEAFELALVQLTQGKTREPRNCSIAL